MIEKRDLAALNYSKEASAYSKQVLAIDPNMHDAHLAIGVENYMLSLKSAPIRWILGMTGAATNREEGIRLLRLTATQGHYLAPFARMMLAVGRTPRQSSPGGPGDSHRPLEGIPPEHPLRASASPYPLTPLHHPEIMPFPPSACRLNVPTVSSLCHFVVTAAPQRLHRLTQSASHAVNLTNHAPNKGLS